MDRYPSTLGSLMKFQAIVLLKMVVGGVWCRETSWLMDTLWITWPWRSFIDQRTMCTHWSHCKSRKPLFSGAVCGSAVPHWLYWLWSLLKTRISSFLSCCLWRTRLHDDPSDAKFQRKLWVYWVNRPFGTVRRNTEKDKVIGRKRQKQTKAGTNSLKNIINYAMTCRPALSGYNERVMKQQEVCLCKSFSFHVLWTQS